MYIQVKLGKDLPAEECFSPKKKRDAIIGIPVSSKEGKGVSIDFRYEKWD